MGPGRGGGPSELGGSFGRVRGPCVVMSTREILNSGRGQLRVIYERQQAALGAYCALEAKADKLRAQLDALAAEQTVALGELVTFCGPEVAATLVNVSVARAREAGNTRRQTAVADGDSGGAA